MDPENPIVKLCAAGIQAEMQHRHADAQSLYWEAWSTQTNDYEACIAAHYLAREQPTLEESLRWNQVAVERADAITDDSVRDFYPSLYLNLGWSHEVLSNYTEAQRCYALAAERMAKLPASPYSEVVKGGIDAAHERIRQSRGATPSN